MQESAAIREESLNDYGNHLILVVDDIQANVMITEAMLKKHKYRTIGTTDPTQVIALIEEHKPDLVLSDLHMPELDGIELCQQIRQNPKTSFTGLMIISAASYKNELGQAFLQGIDDCLSKPFKPVELFGRVHSVLKKVEARKSLQTANEELDKFNFNLEKMVAEKVDELEKVNRLRRFFSPQVVNKYLSENERDVLQSRMSPVSVVFLDLRNFTDFSDSTNPKDIMSFLKKFHHLIGPIIHKHEATLERFTGDGLMCFFGAPEKCSDHAEKAVRMAIELQQAFNEVYDEWTISEIDMHMGIGIATGLAATGVIGFESRLDYAAIGSATNLAARLCGKAEGKEILVSKKTKEHLPSDFHLQFKRTLKIKGFTEEQDIYMVKY